MAAIASGTAIASDPRLANGTSQATSLALPPAGLTEAQLCALGGARFEDQPHSNKDLTVNVGSDAH